MTSRALVVLTTMVSIELYGDVELAMKQTGFSRSALVREALKEYTSRVLSAKQDPAQPPETDREKGILATD